MEQSEIKKEEVVKEPVTNTEETGIKREESGKFIQGTNPPPGPGRPKGSKDFTTILKKAFTKIAKAKDLDVESIETKMVMRAVAEAMKGDFRFFQYLTDRKYGKPLNKIDLHTDSEPITNIEITFIDEIKKDETKHTGNKSVEGESESLPE